MKKMNNKGFLVAAALTIAAAGVSTYAASNNDETEITDLNDSGYTIEWEEGKSPSLWLAENPMDVSEEDQKLMQELHEKVESGEITREEMQEKMEEAGVKMPMPHFHHQGMFQFKGDLTDEQKSILKAIKEKVESGELTWEEAQSELEKAGLPTPEQNTMFIENLSEEDKALLDELHQLREAGEITPEEMRERLEAAGIELPEMPPFGGRMMRFMNEDLSEEQQALMEEMHQLLVEGQIDMEEMQAELEAAGIERPMPQMDFGTPFFLNDALTNEQKEALKEVRGDHEATKALLEEYGIEVPNFERPFEIESEEEIETSDTEG